MATAAGQDQPLTQQQSSGLGALLRGFLSRLLVDIVCGVWTRLKADPEFSAKFRTAFDQLDQAKTPEQNDAAALAIQSLINS